MNPVFGRISLGLSGGGTRAAGYHIGVLAYLDRMGLLEAVSVISGASGGGFITSTYAMSQAKGWSFTTYRDWMLQKLRTGRMAEWVLELFTRGTPKGRSGRRTVISALAEAYDQHFFEGFRFGEFLKPGNDGGVAPVGHLEEVVINATDFRSGLGFRFQLNAPAGNGQSPIDPERLRHARLADVMASSSCLPGGMEPFFFPEDFVWEGPEAVRDCDQLTKEFSALGVQSVPLMDGGLYDNQGLEAMMQAATRIKGDGDSAPDPGLLAEEQVFRTMSESQRFKGEFDLLFQQIAAGKVPRNPPGVVIVSDAVSATDPILRSGFMPGDERPLKSLPEPKDEGPHLYTAYRFWWAMIVLSALTVGVVAYDLVGLLIANDFSVVSVWQHRPPGGIMMLYVMPLILASAVFLALAAARRAASDALDAVDQILETEGRHKADPNAPSTWSYLRHLRVRQIPWLLKIRIASAMSVLSDLFFVRHRILGYSLLYGFPGWRRQLLSVEIFSLDVRPPMDAPPVSDAMKAVGRKAAAQPTAFWYDEPQQLEELVATGQMCMCRNLIVFLRRRLKEREVQDREALQALLDRAEADWAKLSADPMALVPRAARPTGAIGAMA